MAGFYCWQLTEEKYRQPYFVSFSTQVFGVAAFWDRSEGRDDDVIESFTIITVPANPLADTHRPRGACPRFSGAKTTATWLSGTPVRAKAVVHAYPENWMRAHRGEPARELQQPQRSIVDSADRRRLRISRSTLERRNFLFFLFFSEIQRILAHRRRGGR